jgi:ribosomal protein L24
MVIDPDADVLDHDVIVVIDGPDEGERIEVVDVLKGRGRLKAVELRNTDVDPVS